jgi:FdhD protein
MKVTERRTVTRWQRGDTVQAHADELANEEPLEIRVDGRSISVTMRTPGHDSELAAGFLLSEGLIGSRTDLAMIAPARADPTCNVINVELVPGVTLDIDQLTRHVFASSSCGLCGKATIESVHQHFPPVHTADTLHADTLLALPARARATQAVFERTGGLHAAAVFDLHGDLVILREDVGRHNAVDKVLGWALLNDRFPFDRHVLLVSGRASFEIMQKALAGRLPFVAAVSAPSSLAVQFAEDSRQTLVGFVRGDRLNVYAGTERIRFT